MARMRIYVVYVRLTNKYKSICRMHMELIILKIKIMNKIKISII